jgi:hypothetical protein
MSAGADTVEGERVMKAWLGGEGTSAVRSVLALVVLLLPGGLMLLGILALTLRWLRSEPATNAA